MNDLISRRDVMALAKDVVLENGCLHRCIDATQIWELPSAQQWIPCSRRLPKQGQEVICQCRANIIQVLELDADGHWCQNADHCYMSGFVIAWMPLPEPWKGADDDSKRD